jgi:hypothetical protein
MPPKRKYTMSQDGQERTTVRVNFRFTQQEMDLLLSVYGDMDGVRNGILGTGIEAVLTVAYYQSDTYKAELEDEMERWKRGETWIDATD